MSSDKRIKAALITLLRGKTPEAVFDVLHARRCLSAKALQEPDEVTAIVKEFLRPSLQQPLTRNQLERLAAALANSELIVRNSPIMADDGAADEEHWLQR
jgi:hypothetical protein